MCSTAMREALALHDRREFTALPDIFWSFRSIDQTPWYTHANLLTHTLLT